MVERFSICHTSGDNAYLAIRNHDGEWFDFDDNTWKADAADVGEIAASPIVETEIAGRDASQYHADIDLDDINATPRRVVVFADWRVKAGASPDIDTDTPISRSDDPGIEVRCGRISPTIEVEIVPCFDPEGGSGTGRAHFGVTVKADGAAVDMENVEPDSECSLTVKMQGSSNADITGTASAPDADGRFDIHVDDPSLTDNRNYHAVALVTLGDNSTLPGSMSFPVAG